MRTDTEFLKFIEECKKEFDYINDGMVWQKHLDAFYSFVNAKIAFEKTNQ